ncbi:histone-like nucleoid-structuring protein Lsr2 [Streptomyces sp. CB03911]|uniref:Lsr2 family DNA-binding protein n=1 Tax=Streptomyces sp. CB03911 TaxID=1804758 RepID=UPI00093BD191|nr:histone-like nucleoid-structuring protein Lsr2 [Streptomyces sp. CB03911]OKI22231.1 hypothetical protein A6A07_34725 [Streptomyces sp. CB03911]
MTVAALQALIDSEIPGIRRLPAPRLTSITSRGGSNVDASTAVAVSMYRGGETVAAITEATGLTPDRIGAAVTAAGALFVADPAPTAPAPPQEQAAEALIAWGMQHPASRMQRLADQARTALADLQQAQRKEREVTAAEEQLQQAKQLLAAAEEALRTAKGARPPAAASDARPDRDEAALIRAWAREHGEQVGSVGVIPRRLVDAYRAATRDAA